MQQVISEQAYAFFRSLCHSAIHIYIYKNPTNIYAAQHRQIILLTPFTPYIDTEKRKTFLVR